MDIKKYENFSKAGKDSMKKYLYLLDTKPKKNIFYDELLFLDKKNDNDSEDNESYFFHEDIFNKTYEKKVGIDNKKISDKGFYPVQLIFQHPEKTMNPKWKMEKVLNESWRPTQDLKDIFGLKEAWLTRWPSELSGGELQRFSILRALNPETKFIIADEISTMLDAVTQVQIWEALINHCNANNMGILAVSHDQDLLEVICDDILSFDEINNL